MTNEKLVSLIQDGEEGRIEELWENTEKLIRLYAVQYYAKGGNARPDVDLDDLVQVGYFAMLDAIKAYSSDSGYKFSTYLYYHCLNRFNELFGVRSESQRKHQLDFVSLYKPVYSEDDEAALIDFIPSDCDYMKIVEDAIYYQRARADLEAAMVGEPGAEIIRAEYWEGKTIKQIALERGSTPERVRQEKHKCLHKMRKAKVLKPYKDEFINYYFHVGVGGFQRTGISSVEHLAMLREG